MCCPPQIPNLEATMPLILCCSNPWNLPAGDPLLRPIRVRLLWACIQEVLLLGVAHIGFELLNAAISQVSRGKSSVRMIACSTSAQVQFPASQRSRCNTSPILDPCLRCV